MKARMFLVGAALICANVFLFSNKAMACEICEGSTSSHENHIHIGSSANDHAPIGVMGDHMHKSGEWMLSYRYMHMAMDGNRKGSDRIGRDTIVTTEPNRFFGAAGQPMTLRVVPTEMQMDMHMLGAMYAPTDWLTLMLMANYIEKEMNHVTYAGMAGTRVLGEFKTKSEGWGDTKVSTLWKLYKDDIHKIHLNMGVSLPTGSLKESGMVLTPMNMRTNMRLPYGMQLGTGTYDLLPGITYNGQKGPWEWGAQYSAEVRLEDENEEGYAWGNKHSLTTWGSYEWAS